MRWLILFLLCHSVWANGHKLVFLGDSLTEGYGISREHAYPELVSRKLESDGLKIKVVNSGVSGATTAGGLSRMEWILRNKPKYLFIALGANDGLRGFKISEIKKNLVKMISMAKANGVEVFLAGMQMPPNYGDKYTQEFKKVFLAVSKSEEVPLLPFLLDGVAGKKELNLPDGIHPNEKGHEKMAETVYSFLKGRLK